MKQVCITTRSGWRQWLSKNHAKVADGIWLVFYKKDSGKPTLAYDDAVEEALCFGWIDSIIKTIDDEKYCRKFTPRRDGSNWSALNRQRVAKMIKAKKMTQAGLAKIEAAKASGQWEADARPMIPDEVPAELATLLAGNTKARTFFESLAPSYRLQFIGWIATAKRQPTRDKRAKEAMALLAKGKKLGMK